MESWSTHCLYQQAAKELNQDKAFNIQKYTVNLRSQGLPVIFSLRHLSQITGTNYFSLYNTVNRKREHINYNLFAISKRSGGRRFIHATNGELLLVQKYINEEILQKIKPHRSSFAFHKDGGIRKCAEAHCGCKWLFQFDLKDFFYSISEPLVFQIFHNIGYKRLLSFELARLCTTQHMPFALSKYLYHSKWYDYERDDEEHEKAMPYYPQSHVGVLPQGSPSSPMIGNLAAYNLDNQLFNYAQEHGLIYTRYADDLTFSASVLPEKISVAQIRRDIISIIRLAGFRENAKKIRIAGPGSKKLVLGLLVDGELPRISREFKDRIERNLYAIRKFGLDEASKHYKFESVFGYCNHLMGLLSYLKDVDFNNWKKFEPEFVVVKQFATGIDNSYEILARSVEE